MMRVKALFYCFYDKISNYNLFMPEEEENDNDELKDPATVIKDQKYATWCYILLLIGN